MSDCCDTGTFEFFEVNSGATLLSREVEISEDSQADLESVSIKFWASGSATSALTLSSETGELTILQATSPWIIRIEQIDAVTLAEGFYSGKIITTDADGAVEVYVEPTWRIKSAI